MNTEAVKLSIPVEGKEAFEHNYSKEVAESVADIKGIALGRAKGETDEDKQKDAASYMVRAFNYGHDLILRQSERQKASRAAEGPEKQIKKGVDFLVTQGFDAAQARTLIIEQRKTAGLPV